MAKQDMDMQSDGITEEEAGVRVYELGFHLDPELPTEEVKKAYQTIRGYVTDKGTLIGEGEPEKIKLSYVISRQETTGRRDFDFAYFSWIAYETSAENHSAILAFANADTCIIRFIDVLTTKDAARHSVEVHDLSLKAPEHAKESAETMNDTERDAVLERTAA